MTVLPVRFTRFAPAGAFTSAAPPTCAIFPALTTIVALSMTRPLPTTTRAPSKTVADGVCARLAAVAAASKRSARNIRCIQPPGGSNDPPYVIRPWALSIADWALPDLPGRVAALVRPFGAPLVVDPPLGEEPLPVHLDELVFVVAVAVEYTAPLRVVIAVMEPIGAAGRLVAVHLEDDVRDVVTAGRGTKAILRRPRVRHLGDDIANGFAAANFTRADVEGAVLGEGRHVEIGITKIHREQIARLQILDRHTVFCVARPSGS